MESIQIRLKSKIDSILNMLSSLGVNSINLTLQPKLKSSINLTNMLISTFKSFPELICTKFEETLSEISKWLNTWNRKEDKAAGQNSYELENLSILLESLQKSCIYLVIATEETNPSYLETQSSTIYELYKNFDLLSVIHEIKTQEILKRYFKTSYKSQNPRFKRLLKKEFFYFFNEISDFTILELKKTFAISTAYTKDKLKKVVKYIFSYQLEKFNQINNCYLSIQQALIKNQIELKDLLRNDSENFKYCLKLLALRENDRFDKVFPICGKGAYCSERFIEDKVVTVGSEGKWFVNDCNLPCLVEQNVDMVECFFYIMNEKAYIVDLSGKSKIKLPSNEAIKISKELYVNFAENCDVNFSISRKRLRVDFKDISNKISRKRVFKIGSGRICNLQIKNPIVEEIELEVYWDQENWYLKASGENVYYYLRTIGEIINKEPSASYELNPLTLVSLSHFRMVLIPF